MNRHQLLFFVAYCALLAGCRSFPATYPAQSSLPPTSTASHTAQATSISEPAATPEPADLLQATPTQPPVQLVSSPSPAATLAVAAPAIATPTLSAEFWQQLPVIPTVHPQVIDIFQRALDLGNNPKAFSKIGDCGSTPAWFLGDFDRGERFYQLGDYENLQGVIQEFQGSFMRTSLAAKSGYNTAAVLTSLRSDPEQCLSGEEPLACEYRQHQPVIAFIMLGTNDVWHQDTFEAQMRRLIEYSIDHGVIPILSTKADNLEGDGSINHTIARLALEYNLPLVNYWLAVQALPDQGLQEDSAHLTWAPNRFNDPRAMQRAWPVRNLTALQALDAVWQAISHSPIHPP